MRRRLMRIARYGDGWEGEGPGKVLRAGTGARNQCGFEDGSGAAAFDLADEPDAEDCEGSAVVSVVAASGLAAGLSGVAELAGGVGEFAGADLAEGTTGGWMGATGVSACAREGDMSVTGRLMVCTVEGSSRSLR